jgi:hypothetical protein
LVATDFEKRVTMRWRIHPARQWRETQATRHAHHRGTYTPGQLVIQQLTAPGAIQL